jgi:hypothetical protein
MQSKVIESVKQKTVMRTLEVVAVELKEVMAIRAVAAAKLAEVEALEKSLRAEITSNLEAQSLSMARVGGFTVSIRRSKVWAYSKWVTTLEKMLKSRKDKEQKSGLATFTESRTWQFLNVGAK